MNPKCKEWNKAWGSGVGTAAAGEAVGEGGGFCGRKEYSTTFKFDNCELTCGYCSPGATLGIGAAGAGAGLGLVAAAA
jgi:hypothetical protein